MKIAFLFLALINFAACGPAGDDGRIRYSKLSNSADQSEKSGDWEKAIEIAKELVKTADESQLGESRVLARLRLGELFVVKRDYRRSRETLQEARDVCNSMATCTSKGLVEQSFETLDAIEKGQ